MLILYLILNYVAKYKYFLIICYNQQIKEEIKMEISYYDLEEHYSLKCPKIDKEVNIALSIVTPSS